MAGAGRAPACPGRVLGRRDHARIPNTQPCSVPRPTDQDFSAEFDSARFVAPAWQAHHGVIALWRNQRGSDGQLWLANPPLGHHNPPTGCSRGSRFQGVLPKKATSLERSSAPSATATGGLKSSPRNSGVVNVPSLNARVSATRSAFHLTCWPVALARSQL